MMKWHTKICAVSSIILAIACSERRVDPVTDNFNKEQIERGRYLVKGLAACGFCHGESADPQALLVGGRVFYDSLGELKAPNLTSSALATWRVSDFIDLFRVGKAPIDREISTEVHKGFEWLSDADLVAVVAYLRTVPPVENSVERREASFLQRNSLSAMAQPTYEVRGYVPSIDPKHVLEYGRYLVDHVARCTYCHNSPANLLTSEEYLAGGKNIQIDDQAKQAPGITNSQVFGVGSWNEVNLVDYLKSGRKPDGQEVDHIFCPVRYYANSSDADLIAMARYLLANQ